MYSQKNLPPPKLWQLYPKDYMERQEMFTSKYAKTHISLEQSVEVIVPEEDTQLSLLHVLAELIQPMVGQLTGSGLQK